MNLKRHAFVVFVRASRKYLICHNFHEAFGQTLRNWCYFFRSFESFWLGATWTPFDKDTRKCIQGPLLSWLRSFLTNRYQGVVLRGHHSSWTSVLNKDSNTLEKVQRIAASKFSLGNIGRDMSYEERLEFLKWLTLQQRRLFSSLTECYKTISRLNGLDPSALFYVCTWSSALKS